MKLSDIFFGALAVNLCWCVAGAIRDCMKTDRSNVWSRIDRDLSISIRNLKCAAINVALALIVVIYAIVRIATLHK